MILFYDTETTGLPDYRSPSGAKHQPHIVQFAAILVDPETKIERACVDLIVKPNGWEIPKEVSDIHGITNDTAHVCGVDERHIANIFLDMRERAALEVAHNISFDRRIMRIASVRELEMTREEIDDSESKAAFCTMKAALRIVNLPPTQRMLAAGFSGPKQPKLSECIKYFFNEELDGAHNALVDVRACSRLYFHLLETAK